MLKSEKKTRTRKGLRWCGHLDSRSENRKPKQILEARIKGKRERGRPRI